MAKLVSLIPTNTEAINKKKIQKEDVSDIHASLPASIKHDIEGMTNKIKSMNLSKDKEALIKIGKSVV